LLLLHGTRDQRVPVEHSRDFVAAAREAGDRIDYREYPDTDHFALLDPGHVTWREAVAWMESMAEDNHV
jgi:dipeptidyl aminopeptidase/acylaminoacyl peptidase